jgi:hypothetical protein
MQKSYTILRPITDPLHTSLVQLPMTLTLTLLFDVGQKPYLCCWALDARERKEEIVWISDNWKFMRLSGLEMKYRGV